MAVNPDDKGAARLARPGAAFKQYWVLFIGKITAAQPFEYSDRQFGARTGDLVGHFECISHLVCSAQRVGTDQVE